MPACRNPRSERERQFITVYEAQEVTDWQVCEYLVEATSYEAAVEAVREGDADPVSSSYCGEPEFGNSGYGRNRVEAVKRLGQVLAEAEQPQVPPIQPGPPAQERESV